MSRLRKLWQFFVREEEDEKVTPPTEWDGVVIDFD